MQNICFLNSTGFWGGGEKLHLEYAYAFYQKGYQVTLAVKEGTPLHQRADALGIPTFFVQIGNLSFLDVFTLRRLARFFQDQNIDTVVFSTSQDMKTGSVAGAWANVRQRVYLRGLAVPVKANVVNRWIFQHKLTHIVANSEETKRNILKHLHPYIPAEKVAVIYHGIEWKNLPNNAASKLSMIQKRGRGIVLGNAGRLTEQKGQLYLIEIARILKARAVDFTLFIAGTGELETQLQEKIMAYELENEVILLGFVREMALFMQSIDVFLLSSVWEGFGYVLVEAMIQSKPVIAFNITSNPEIIANNETGFLVDFPDVQAFAERIIELANNTALQVQMGKAGQQRVYDHFRMADRIDEFENYLQQK